MSALRSVSECRFIRRSGLRPQIQELIGVVDTVNETDAAVFSLDHISQQSGYVVQCFASKATEVKSSSFELEVKIHSSRQDKTRGMYGPNRHL